MSLFGEDPVTVIGASCRFPGGINDLKSLWDAMVDTKPESSLPFQVVPEGRWTLQQEQQTEACALPPSNLRDLGGQPSAALLEDPDLVTFSPAYFGLTETEARALDPSTRLLLTVTAQAVCNAGLEKGFANGKAVGVFIGMSNDGEWAAMNPAARVKNGGGAAAQIISRSFGLRGPSNVVDTGCSSSLAALEAAMQMFRLRKCDVAIVGGVNLLLSSRTHQQRIMSGLLSESAGHYPLGEGCGVMVLRRRSTAEADRNPILAWVCGAQVSHVGRKRTEDQGDKLKELVKDVVQEASQQNQQAKGGRVCYVETSGTGRIKDDAWEVECLADVYCSQGREARLAVGCVKPLVGHMDAASGMAGLMKALAILQQGQVPPQQHGLTALRQHLQDKQQQYDHGLIIPLEAAAPPDDRQATREGGMVVAVNSMSWVSGVAGHAILMKPYHGHKDGGGGDDEVDLMLSEEEVDASMDLLMPPSMEDFLPGSMGLDDNKTRDEGGKKGGGEEEGMDSSVATTTATTATTASGGLVPDKPVVFDKVMQLRWSKQHEQQEEEEEVETADEARGGANDSIEVEEEAPPVPAAAPAARGGARSNRGGVRAAAADAPEFLAALAKRDKALVLKWVRGGYEAQGSALVEAIKWGNAQVFQSLLLSLKNDSILEHTATVDDYKKANLLHLAVLFDRPALIPKLYEAMIRHYQAVHGNTQGFWQGMRDGTVDHSLPMHYAVRTGKPACVAPLVKAGHPPDLKDYGYFAPIHFVGPKDQDILNALLAGGSDLNVPDNKGKTILFWAVQYAATAHSSHSPDAWRKLAACLIEKGADYGPCMLRLCQTDLSIGVSPKPVPVIKQQQQQQQQATKATDGPAYPLFAYAEGSLGNPVGGMGCLDPHNGVVTKHDTRKTNCHGCAGGRFLGSTSVLSKNGFSQPVLFECGPTCHCHGLCSVTKESFAVDVEVFYQAENATWSVRTKSSLKKGQYVGTFVGEYMTAEAVEDRRAKKSGKVQGGDPRYVVELTTEDDKSIICIDATFLGNVTRLFNHHSGNGEPTLVMKKVMCGRLYPKAAFFAARDLEAMEELTITPPQPA